MNNKAVVYALIDPRFNEIRYIGITTQSPNQRLIRHISEARHSLRRDHRVNWIKSLLDIGIKPEFKIISDTTKENIFKEERKQITHFRNLGYRLTNSTDGGEGVLNPSPETRAKMSYHARNKSLETRKKLSLAMTGKKHSQETKKKISEHRKGKRSPPITDAGRLKIIQAMKGNKNWLGRHHSEESKKKISLLNMGNKARLGIPHSLATKVKLSIMHSADKSSSAKLTWEQVRTIREKYSVDNITMQELANQYDVTIGTIHPIIRNRTWIENGR